MTNKSIGFEVKEAWVPTSASWNPLSFHTGPLASLASDQGRIPTGYRPPFCTRWERRLEEGCPSAWNAFLCFSRNAWKKLKVLVTQSWPTLCNPVECSPPGSSVHGILQARILEWVAISFSRGSSPTQGLNLSLLHCRQILYHVNHQGSLVNLHLSFQTQPEADHSDKPDIPTPLRTVVPKLFGTRHRFHGRKFSHNLGQWRGGRGGDSTENIQASTVTVRFISVSIPSAAPQIIRHQMPEVGEPWLKISTYWVYLPARIIYSPVPHFRHLMQRTDSLEKTLMLERWKAGEGDDRGWDGWMPSPTLWTWVWVDSGSCWWTGRPGVLQAMGLQRVGQDWATELTWVFLTPWVFGNRAMHLIHLSLCSIWVLRKAVWMNKCFH